MATRTSIRLAVLSDIHASSSGQDHARGTYITVPALAGRSNPLEDLHKQLAPELKGTVDYLVCPGDIANQADPDAFKWMWGELKRLAKSLEAREVVATCGNHDLDSRMAHSKGEDPDPKGALLALDDPFPNLTEHELNHFWARNYVVIERNDPSPHRVLLVNTCAYHGGEPNEIKHGRISGRTIEAILKSLNKKPKLGLNLLLCHHHLMPLPAWDNEPDYQYVRKGGELLRRLEEVDLGPWMVIHGHRHWPECIYASGGASSAVIFCAASFGKSDALISNQFHLLDIHLDSNASRPKGTIKTWSWTLAGGWQPAEKGPRALSYSCGFGFEGSLAGVVSKIDGALAGTKYLDWPDVLSIAPEIEYLLPSDFNKFSAALKSSEIRIHLEDGQPSQIGKRVKK